MKCCNNFVLIILCVLVIVRMPFFLVSANDVSLEVAPPWLKVGTYVQYEGTDVYFVFLDGTQMILQETKFVFRWECTALSEQMATINMTVYIPQRTFRISKTVNITTNTREIYAINGTLLGKACLWLPPFLKVGDRIAVSGKPPNEKTTKVTYSGGSSCITCQGYQELYHMGSLGEGFLGFFDLDTGLLLSGILDYTTIVNLMGFREMGLLKLITDTNVNLGARYLRTELSYLIINTMPIWIPALIFAVTVVVIVRKRRKKRHSAKANRLRK